MKEFWNQRYGSNEYIYGKEPNDFFREMVDTYLSRGKIILPAEGEGRNAVYAAKKGLEVYAFDISDAGKEKALALAHLEGVSIRYEVGELQDLDLENENFDAAAFIYAHFPLPVFKDLASRISRLLNPGAFVFMEAFSEGNLPYRSANPAIGGPDIPDLLYTIEKVRSAFPDQETLLLEEVEVELSEGRYHNGTGKVVRYIGRKSE